MATFANADRPIIQQAIPAFTSWFESNVKRYLGMAGLDTVRMPSEWNTLEGSLRDLEAASREGGESFTIRDELLPLLKRVVIVRRRGEAVRIQQMQDKTHHLEVLGALDIQLEALDQFIQQSWFRDTIPAKIPRITDILPIKRIEEFIGQQIRLSERKYDEKFHILQAPELFLQDLQYYRTITDLRGTATAIAFLDIDHLKTFNKDYTETRVDRNLLPRFMQCLEAHVHFHGQVYRQGGDEYLVLLPGFSRSFAIAFLDELRQKVSQVKYPQINRNTTISIGLCIADPDCHLTDRELQEMANKAKERAKGTKAEEQQRQGRNRIAAYKGNLFRDDDLEIVRTTAGDA
jgi:diguanylate cyclase (GGDEF)-like protein